MDRGVLKTYTNPNVMLDETTTTYVTCRDKKDQACIDKAEQLFIDRVTGVSTMTKNNMCSKNSIPISTPMTLTIEIPQIHEDSFIPTEPDVPSNLHYNLPSNGEPPDVTLKNLYMYSHNNPDTNVNHLKILKFDDLYYKNDTLESQIETLQQKVQELEKQLTELNQCTQTQNQQLDNSVKYVLELEDKLTKLSKTQYDLFNSEKYQLYQQLLTISKYNKPLINLIKESARKFNELVVDDNPKKIAETSELVETNFRNQLNKTNDKIDKCEWCHNEDEVLSVLHLYKPDKFVEYIAPIQLSINELVVNNQVVAGSQPIKNQNIIDVELPESKFASQLIGFRAILKSDIWKDNIPELKFVLKGGNANIQTIKYKPSKGLISPRMNLPECLFDDNIITEASKGRFTRYYSDITSIEVESKYVRDIYGFYRINSSVISDKFRVLDFYGKYKFNTKKLIAIFKHDYNELQYACQHNLLDIVKWIVYSNEQDNIEQTYTDINQKKEVYKKSLYIICGDVIDKTPQPRLFNVAKQALESKSYDVANFLFNELMYHLDFFESYNKNNKKIIMDGVIESVCRSKSLECINLVQKLDEFINRQSDDSNTDEEISKRLILDNHIKLHHDSLLNK
jgi:hypothetical protein